MHYKGVRYSLLVGIKRGQWRIVVLCPDGKTLERVVHGSKDVAESLAQTMITRWRNENPRAAMGLIGYDT